MGNAFGIAGGRYFGRPTSEGDTIKPPVVSADAEDEDDDDLDDPVERMLKKTGCLEKHYSVQECIADTKDWRQCQKQVQDFRACMDKYKNKSTESLK